jgi:capsular exopolysaccharide synthesis family protein
VSRIYDALRKAKQETVDKGSQTSTDVPKSVEEAARRPRDRKERAKLRVRRVTCRLRPEEHIVSIGKEAVVGSEKYRILRHRIQQIRQQRPLKKLLITSPLPKEGKTLSAINTAITFSLLRSRVVLIDADLRNPTIHRVLGIPAMPGLVEYLEGGIDLEDALRYLEPLGMFYLPAGRAAPESGELLQRPKLRELMDQLDELFDWIVIDSAPVNLFADAPALATLVDGVLLVVRSGQTPSEAVQHCLDALAGSFVAGVMLNAHDESAGEQSYAYGYGYANRSSGGKIAGKA